MSRLRLSPLYQRLLLWFCTANLVTLVVSVALAGHFARLHLNAQPDWQALASEANSAYIAGGTRALDAWIDSRHHDDGLDVALFEQGFSLSSRPLPPPMERHLRQLLAADNSVLHPRPDITVAGQRVVGEDGVPRHFVGMRAPHPPLPPLRQFFALELLLSIAVIGLVGWWLARGIARPVDAVAAAARGMAAGELGTRVPERLARGDDELSRLARDFNAMAARIEALVAHERSVLQDISHELRSPLARLRLNLELARGDAGNQPQLAAADREVTRLDRLLSEVLSLARLEADLPGMTREHCELGELARNYVERLRGEAALRSTPIDVQVQTPAYVLGSASLLERAIENLLSNALKYAAGAPVHVVVDVRDDTALLQVRDGGVGVPEAELVQMFRPFFRGANAPRAEGQGLGLAIVTRIAQAHAGAAQARRLSPHGFEVSLQLPLAPPA